MTIFFLGPFNIVIDRFYCRRESSLHRSLIFAYIFPSHISPILGDRFFTTRGPIQAEESRPATSRKKRPNDVSVVRSRVSTRAPMSQGVAACCCVSGVLQKHETAEVEDEMDESCLYSVLRIEPKRIDL
ncbi:hypothetical protein AVEN_9107-1 [Araneus ventricosus]|uniref:Uncharacterized protein n=1 Tax=Araneus ventricosus TaxID=182803 RepID=A0A4Y2PB38_ARAVE|nr:hypothetical protein AVEN_9107-1 [Araneus ventricosus]